MLLTITTITRRVLQATAMTQVALGLLFWIHRALGLLPVHMLIGLIFVLSLWTLAGLAVWSGGRLLPLLALGLGIVIPVFGIMQVQLLPGSAHWLVQVVHLLLGVAGMVLAARLDRWIRAQARKEGPASPADSAAVRTRRAA